MRIIRLLIGLVLMAAQVQAQDFIPLYEGEIPKNKPGNLKSERVETTTDGKQRVYDITVPGMQVFLPAASVSNGVAVIICPGSGYRFLNYTSEGTDAAKLFNQWGITAFVLKYRLPDDQTQTDKSVVPEMDVMRAIQVLRMRYKTWGLNPKKIGLVGFSSGGHAAAGAASYFEKPLIYNSIDVSLRPDFLILAYPVISFQDDIASKGTREQLLGKVPEPAQIQYFSIEKNISKKNPPTFITHAKDDKAVKLENSLRLIEALEKNKVKYSHYFYDAGGTGFGINNPANSISWTGLVQQWLFDLEIISKK
jgi:acetyl esterase/lipase